MVLVTVREDDGLEPILVLPQISHVGNDEIHAEELGVGEHDSHVDDDHRIA